MSLLEPGDRVLVPVFGRFGHLLAEIAARCGAEVHTIEVPWGEVFAPEAVEEAVVRVRPHAARDGAGRHLHDHVPAARRPRRDLPPARRAPLRDATASLGGNPFEMDAWGIDAATAGLQKCLCGPVRAARRSPCRHGPSR